jgi:hypothetical protein
MKTNQVIMTADGTWIPYLGDPGDAVKVWSRGFRDRAVAETAIDFFWTNGRHPDDSVPIDAALRRQMIFAMMARPAVV